MNDRQAQSLIICKLEARGFKNEARRPELVIACLEAAREIAKDQGDMR